MDIFIDSTELFNDPLWKNNYHNSIIKYAEKKIINIYISQLVIDETRNNYKKSLKKIKDVIESKNQELKYLISENYEFPKIDIMKEIDYFDKLYLSMEEKKIIKIVQNSKDCFDELINRSINRIKPFSENKNEFRDAIIWLSYVNRIKKDNIKIPYFISNNLSDYYHDNGCKLHDDLLKDCDRIIPYKTIKEFLSVNEGEINRLIDNKSNLDKFLESNPIDHVKIEYLLTKTYLEQIRQNSISFINNLSIYEINGDFAEAIIEPEGKFSINDIVDYNINYTYDNIIISGTIEISCSINIYYKYVYPSGYSEFRFESVEEIIYIADYNFIYDDPIEAHNFDIFNMRLINQHGV